MMSVYTDAQVNSLVMLSIGIVISIYSLVQSIKLYRRQSTLSYAREKLYKRCLVAACVMVTLQVSSHFISDALNPLEYFYSDGTRILHVIVHCIVYRMLESIIDYSRALVIACDVIIYASYAFFLALGGVIVFAMWSRCGVYEFNCFLDVRKEYMGWVFMSQVWYYALEILFGVYAIYNIVFKCRGPKQYQQEKGQPAIPSPNRSHAAKQKYRIKVIFFLVLWSINLALLTTIMFAYCFANFGNIGSLLLHSILSIFICMQFAMTVNFTKVISFIIEMRSCEREMETSGMSTTAFMPGSFKESAGSDIL